MCTPSKSREHMEAGKPTLGALFRLAGKAFFAQNYLSANQAKIAMLLSKCQTAALGGHLWCCDSCGALVPMYCSCRNRNCPQCQRMDQFRWVSARVQELLPVPYFHCVFTLPHELNPLIAANPRPLIGALFKAASTTLLKFGRDPKWMGGKPGILMVLHTWGQKLNLHYHVHCIVTGGGLTTKGEWAPSRSEKYLFPIAAMSPVFRGLYWEHLLRLLQSGKLDIPKQHTSFYGNREALQKRLYSNNWVVYAKEPFAGPATVLKYLARYTHRTAIGNSRILSCKNGMVTFNYMDYRNHQRKKAQLCLPLQDFLGRFIAHVLPSGLMRIRSYGIWANARKKRDLGWCRYLLGEPKNLVADPKDVADPNDNEKAVLIALDQGLLCPYCKTGYLQVVSKELAGILWPVVYLDSS